MPTEALSVSSVSPIASGFATERAGACHDVAEVVVPGRTLGDLVEAAQLLADAADDQFLLHRQAVDQQEGEGVGRARR